MRENTGYGADAPTNFRVPVELEQDAPVHGVQNIQSKLEMVEVLRKLVDITTLALLQSGLGREDLLATTEHPTSQDRLMVRPDYELRYIQLRFTVGGFLGKVPAVKMQWNAGRNYDNAMKGIRLSQPNCAWAVVGARIFERALTKGNAPTVQVGIDHDGSMHGMPGEVSAMQAFMDAGTDRKKTSGNPNAFSRSQVGSRMYLELAVANLDRGPIRDPWADLNNGVPGTLSKYLDQPYLRHLPESLRKQRVNAERVINAFFDAADARRDVHPEPDVPPDDEVDYGTDTKPGDQRAASKIETPTEPPAPGGAVADLTDLVLGDAYGRRQRGEKWQSISEGTGHTWQKMQKAVATWAKAHPDMAALAAS